MTFYVAYPRPHYPRPGIPKAVHLVPGLQKENKTTFCGRSAQFWLWDDDPVPRDETLVLVHLCKTCSKAADPEILQGAAFRILSGEVEE